MSRWPVLAAGTLALASASGSAGADVHQQLVAGRAAIHATPGAAYKLDAAAYGIPEHGFASLTADSLISFSGGHGTSGALAVSAAAAAGNRRRRRDEGMGDARRSGERPRTQLHMVVWEHIGCQRLLVIFLIVLSGDQFMVGARGVQINAYQKPELIFLLLGNGGIDK